MIQGTLYIRNAIFVMCAAQKKLLIGCFHEALKVSPGGDLQNYQENTSVGISFLVKLQMELCCENS